MQTKIFTPSFPDFAIEPSHLQDLLQGHPGKVKLFDATYYLPTEGKNPREEFKKEHIPGAQFFDIDEIADHSTPLPHMLPGPERFSQAMTEFGICHDDWVVVYDQRGVFSAPRLWWTLKIYGHEKVVVLNGGLPAWKAQGGELTSGPAPVPAAQDEPYLAEKSISRAVIDKAELLSRLGDSGLLILDARTPERFAGTIPEPREGVASGHIPGSLNLPFTEFLQPDKTLRPIEEIRGLFTEKGVTADKEIVTLCGSGVTAAILSLGLAQIGYRSRLYDASWVEWGAASDVPIEKGP